MIWTIFKNGKKTFAIRYDRTNKDEIEKFVEEQLNETFDKNIFESKLFGERITIKFDEWILKDEDNVNVYVLTNNNFIEKFFPNHLRVYCRNCRFCGDIRDYTCAPLNKWSDTSVDYNNTKIKSDLNSDGKCKFYQEYSYGSTSGNNATYIAAGKKGGYNNIAYPYNYMDSSINRHDNKCKEPSSYSQFILPLILGFILILISSIYIYYYINNIYK